LDIAGVFLCCRRLKKYRNNFVTDTTTQTQQIGLMTFLDRKEFVEAMGDENGRNC